MSAPVNVYETAINHVTIGDDKDEYVMIETSQQAVITALLKKPNSFEVVEDDRTPGYPRLIRFRIPVNDVNWGALAKRKGSPRPDAHRHLPGRSET